MQADAASGGAPSDERPSDDPSSERSSDPVRISPLRRRHLRAVMRIEAQAVHRGWSVGLYLAELRREHDRIYVVAKVRSQVVGYAGMLFQEEDAHVTTIGVDEAWQRRGIGTRLMHVLMTRANARPASNVTLEVRATNEAAVGLYRQFGLAPAGVRKNYYADIGEDALIMWGHDIDTPAYAQRLAGIGGRFDGPTILEGLDP